MSRDTKIKDVKGIWSHEIGQEKEVFATVNYEGCIPLNRNAIIYYADEPCVEACQLLYDLNIETFTSGCHSGDERAFIGIRYETLSEDNKKIAQEMIHNGLIEELKNDGHGSSVEKSIYLEVLVNEASLVGEVSDKLVQLASMFQQQDVLYGKKTIDELKIEEEELSLPGWAEIECNKMYSLDGIVYFETEDLLNKHIEYNKKFSISQR